ncbi:hypothetical protein QTP70_022702, partial [Hemibagrus guttatus]
MCCLVSAPGVKSMPNAAAPSVMSSKEKTVGASAPGIPSSRDYDSEPSSEEDEGLRTDGPDTGSAIDPPSLKSTNAACIFTVQGGGKPTIYSPSASDLKDILDILPNPKDNPIHFVKTLIQTTRNAQLCGADYKFIIMTKMVPMYDEDELVAKVAILDPKHDTPEYPLSEDKARGIDKILSALLDQGVVVPVHSSYNTPVNPVLKPNVVHSSLQDLILPEGAVVLQYADDLLISAETADIRKEATWSLLNRLAQQGFKVSLSKLQFCKTEAAELVALTRACIPSAEKDVTIYTDSRYAFGVAHDFGRIWQTRGFVSAEEHAWRARKSAEEELKRAG